MNNKDTRPHWFSSTPAIEKSHPAAWKAAIAVCNIQYGVYPLLSQKARRKAVAKYAKRLEKVPGNWWQKRVTIEVTAELMGSEKERRALNQGLALASVPCYFHSIRVRSLGRDEYILCCTWHHDKEFFLSVPVSVGEVITATGLTKAKYEAQV